MAYEKSTFNMLKKKKLQTGWSRDGREMDPVYKNISIDQHDFFLHTLSEKRTHIQQLASVFQKLHAAKLTLNMKKCNFLKRELKFLVTSSPAEVLKLIQDSGLLSSP